MFSSWMPRLPALVAVLALSATAVAQRRPEDPCSRVWLVEVNGVMNHNELYIFEPDRSGDGTWGTWQNFEGNRVYGWGYYYWDPVSGTIEYINLSGDGGGNQTGQYTWDGEKYVRTKASHPEAPPMALH